MLGDYVRADRPNNSKKYATAFAVLGLVGVVALVGVVSHGHGEAQLNEQHLMSGPTTKQYDHLFRAWINHFERKYENFSEFTKRFEIFVKNTKFIEHHNSQNGMTYNLALNQFADLTREEFGALFHGFGGDAFHHEKKYVALPTDNLPGTVDWSAKGAVTAPKNQGQCGSCWAFSTTGSLEGLNFIKNGKLESFSEQQLVDCSGSYGNQGCSGGLMDDAFKYVEKYGIEKESDYPYEGSDGTCHYDASKVAFRISGYQDVPQKDNLQLKAAVAQQPVSVAIEADQLAFQFYSGGVLTGNCGTKLDHGVLVVGYGTDDDTKYWKVKNSWGGSWGEEGYVRIERTDGTAAGKCGIALSASYPTA
mmetsp:Transcript_52378/g.59867  ORF Transcript_52378/g.59867 Transcript_52378/m.59867 type:complete len:362 (-) Transcript_52378:423-1508(-)